MPTWGGILRELQDSTQGGTKPPDFDGVRRKYIVGLQKATGRNVILYATKWTQPDTLGMGPGLVSITDEDMEGLMETIHGLQGETLDLILHSPGGSPEAAEALVNYLRSKFKNIRAIVPHAAMSAATMVCCATDCILLGKHSFLGPIDPQFILSTPLGITAVPAQAILDQFAKAREECKDASNLPAWLPMLSQFGPGLLIQCENALRMSKDVVQRWLGDYMFAGLADGKGKAAEIADWLASHDRFKSHGRHIPRTELEARGLKIEHLEDNQAVQELVLSIFHATMHTFSSTGCVKLIENHLGKAWVKMASLTQLAAPQGGVPISIPIKLPK